MNSKRSSSFRRFLATGISCMFLGAPALSVCAPMPQHASGRNTRIFAEQAFSGRALHLRKSLAIALSANVLRKEAHASLFGRGYSREQAQALIQKKIALGDFESVKLGPGGRPPRSYFLFSEAHTKMRSAMRLVSSEDDHALLKGKTFRFLDLTHVWKGVMEWRALIFEWENRNRFIGGYADRDAVYLPYGLISRLLQIHHDASKKNQFLIKQKSLEVLRRLLHHEAEHLRRAAGWEDPEEVDLIVKELDRLFRALRAGPFGRAYLRAMDFYDALRRPMSRWTGRREKTTPSFQPIRVKLVPRFLAAA